jgi:hypothetical protein
VEAKPMLAAEAKRNQLANLKRGKESPRSVKNDKTVNKPIDARKEVAKKFDVSQGYVYAAQKIKDTIRAYSLSLPGLIGNASCFTLCDSGRSGSKRHILKSETAPNYHGS